MRISDWSSDVCSSDLPAFGRELAGIGDLCRRGRGGGRRNAAWSDGSQHLLRPAVSRALSGAGRSRRGGPRDSRRLHRIDRRGALACVDARAGRSEEHTSELQSLMRNSYAVFCLKKKKKAIRKTITPRRL